MTERNLQIPEAEQEYMNAVIKRVLIGCFNSAEDRAFKLIERSRLPRKIKSGPNAYGIQTAVEIILLGIDDAREVNGIDRQHPDLVGKYS